MEGIFMKISNSSDRFVVLAEKRVTRAIKDLRLIGNLSNRSNYTYTNQDVKKIISVLEEEMKILRKRFETKGRPSEVDFKL